MPLPLEHVDTGTATGRNFETIAIHAPDFGSVGVSARKGSTNLAWLGGSTLTNIAAVAHGLGAVPSQVICTQNTSGPSALPRVGNFTSTTFDLIAETIDGSLPVAATATTIHWIALT